MYGPPPGAAVAAPLIPFPFSKMSPAKTDYFWWPYVPRGKLVLLEGDEASGKTWLAVELAAWITQGTALPGPEKPKNEAARQPLPLPALLCMLRPDAKEDFGTGRCRIRTGGNPKYPESSISEGASS